ncbi:uncharacterized protein LOC135944995 [Cloeon dipterum]|uniref:uncharacterized protein LOC135944995 n=1 Tax=Cloeon dipterum TaxID=197152 RepID=UPI00321FDC38
MIARRPFLHCLCIIATLTVSRALAENGVQQGNDLSRVRVRRQADNSTTTTTPTTTTTTPTTTTYSTTTTSATTTKSTTTTTAGKSTTKSKTEQYAKVPCSGVNPKLLTSCCESPIADFFTDDQKLNCSEKKRKPLLFSATREYMLSKFQDTKTGLIDFSTKRFAAQIGPRAVLAQCLFQETKLMDESGNIDEEALISFMTENLDAEWQTLISDAITNCKSEVEGVQTETMDVVIKPRVTKTSSTMPFLYLQCVIRRANANCPTSLQKTNGACKRAFSVMGRCSVQEKSSGKAARSARRSNKAKKQSKFERPPGHWGPVLKTDLKSSSANLDTASVA